MSELEDTLLLAIRGAGLPEPEREVRFCARRWKVDFFWRDRDVIAEVEGGTWTGGRHTRANGFEGDCEKYNMATLLGKKVLRFTGAMVRDGRALDTLRQALG